MVFFLSSQFTQIHLLSSHPFLSTLLLSLTLQNALELDPANVVLRSNLAVVWSIMDVCDEHFEEHETPDTRDAGAWIGSMFRMICVLRVMSRYSNVVRLSINWFFRLEYLLENPRTDKWNRLTVGDCSQIGIEELFDRLSLMRSFLAGTVGGGLNKEVEEATELCDKLLANKIFIGVVKEMSVQSSVCPLN